MKNGGALFAIQYPIHVNTLNFDCLRNSKNVCANLVTSPREIQTNCAAKNSTQSLFKFEVNDRGGTAGLEFLLFRFKGCISILFIFI